MCVFSPSACCDPANERAPQPEVGGSRAPLHPWRAPQPEVAGSDRAYRSCVVSLSVGSPTGPEVHYTRTILFAAEVALSAFCGQRYFLLIIIHTEFSLLSFYIY